MEREGNAMEFNKKLAEKTRKTLAAVIDEMDEFLRKCSNIQVKKRGEIK